MSLRQGNTGNLFRNNKWLMVIGVILAIILAIAVRSRQMDLKGAIPSQEPTISVFFHQTGETKSLPLETYLEGVIAAEMDPNWPLAALEAQAIVARTFTLKKMGEGPIKGRNAQASTDPKEFQAYDASKVNDRVKQAVNNTRGQVITYGGKPIIAWFHASSGGRTASAVEGLNYRKENAPYAQPVTDIQQEPVHVWTATFSSNEIINAATSLGVQSDKLTSISIGRKGASGRAETLVINGKEVSAPQFRLAVGDKKMRSTLIDSLRLEGATVHMKGRGYGHGVGMSQWGAWLLAQRGKSAQEIVTYYFKGVRIQDSWK